VHGTAANSSASFQKKTKLHFFPRLPASCFDLVLIALFRDGSACIMAAACTASTTSLGGPTSCTPRCVYGGDVDCSLPRAAPPRAAPPRLDPACFEALAAVVSAPLPKGGALLPVRVLAATPMASRNCADETVRVSPAMTLPVCERASEQASGQASARVSRSVGELKRQYIHKRVIVSESKCVCVCVCVCVSDCARIEVERWWAGKRWPNKKRVISLPSEH
jgi:hypothetical protein